MSMQQAFYRRAYIYWSVSSISLGLTLLPASPSVFSLCVCAAERRFMVRVIDREAEELRRRTEVGDGHRQQMRNDCHFLFFLFFPPIVWACWFMVTDCVCIFLVTIQPQGYRVSLKIHPELRHVHMQTQTHTDQCTVRSNCALSFTRWICFLTLVWDVRRVWWVGLPRILFLSTIHLST